MEVSNLFCNFWAHWVAHILPSVWFFFLLKNTHNWFMQRRSVGGKKKKKEITQFWILKVFILPSLFSEHLAECIVFLFPSAFWKILSCCFMASVVAAEKIETGSVSLFLSVISLSLLPSLPDNFHAFYL